MLVFNKGVCIMYLSAVSGLSSNYQTNFKAKISRSALDVIVPEAKHAGKLGDLSAIVEKLPAVGTSETMVDYNKSLQILCIVHPDVPTRVIPLKGKNVLEQVMSLKSPTTVICAENELANGRGISLYC